MRVAVQTRPWGPEMNRQRLASVLAEVRAAGYDGIEIGAQHLDVSRPEVLRELLREQELLPAAIHVGGDIYNPDSVAEALRNLERTVAYASAVGAPHLAFSGKAKEGRPEEELGIEAESLERLGRLCRDHGLVLAYHNHWWEIQNDCRELRFICEHTDPGLVSLCLDVAWVWRGGASPAALAEEFLPRIAYLHLKDTTEDRWKELGRGKLDLGVLFGVIAGKDFNWAVVEQDETDGPAVDSARASREYLRENWKV